MVGQVSSVAQAAAALLQTMLPEQFQKLLLDGNTDSGSSDDYLPRPSCARYEPLEVAYVCEGTNSDDLLPFLTYPKRQGWTEEDILNPSLSGRLPKEINAFFQNWLFFSMLSDVMHVPIDRSDFVRKTMTKSVISTLGLPDLIKNWYREDRHLPPSQKEEHGRRCDAILRYMCKVLCEWTSQPPSPLHDSMMLQLAMLGQYLNILCTHLYGKTKGSSSAVHSILGPSDEAPALPIPSWAAVGLRWDLAAFDAQRRLIDQRMLDAGWCPSDISRLAETLPLAGLFYASMLQVPGSESLLPHAEKPREVHLDGSSTQTSICDHLIKAHERCSTRTCHAYDFDDIEYNTSHTTSDCPCSHISVNMGDVVAILKADQIPILKLDPSCLFGALPRLSVVSAEGIPFTAISHVWSDGLGNPHANSLPTCQVRSIAEAVMGFRASIAEPIYFWLDTFCCPLKPTSARKKAIRSMNETYAKASRVLVLESYIRSQNFHGAEQVEILAIIWCSKWYRRLWTLSEGLQPKFQLHFQFQDEVVRLSDIAFRRYPLFPSPSSEHEKEESEVLQHIQGRLGFERMVFLRTQAFNNMPHTSLRAISILLGLLSFRATTKAADEALCIGLLLKLPMQKILDAPENQRMKAVWSWMPKIPPDIVFLKGSRLKAKGFRWAPATFAAGVNDASDLWDIFRKSPPAGVLTSEGLTIKCRGLKIGATHDLRIKANEVLIVDAAGQGFFVRCYRPTGVPFSEEQVIMPQTGQWQSMQQPVMCLLSRYSLNEDEKHLVSRTYEGLLVVAEMRSFAAETMMARTVCPVDITTIEPGGKSAEILEHVILTRDEHMAPLICALGTWTSIVECNGVWQVTAMGFSKISGGVPLQWCID